MLIFQETCQVAHSLAYFPLSLAVNNDIVAAVDYSGAEACGLFW